MRFIIEGRENFLHEVYKNQNIIIVSYWSTLQNRGYIEIKEEK